MATESHKVAIDLDFQTQSAEARLGRIEAILNRINQTAGGVNLGGGRGGRGGGGAIGPGGGGGGGVSPPGSGNGGAPAPDATAPDRNAGSTSAPGGGGGGAGPGGGGGPAGPGGGVGPGGGGPAGPGGGRNVRGSGRREAMVMGGIAGYMIGQGASQIGGAISMQGQISPGMATTYGTRIAAGAAQGVGGTIAGFGAATGNPALMAGGALVAGVGAVTGSYAERQAALAEAAWSASGRLANIDIGIKRMQYKGGFALGRTQLMDIGEKYGMAANEALSGLSAYTQAAGMRGSPTSGMAGGQAGQAESASQVLNLMNAGFSPGALGGYRGQIAAGYGGRGGSMTRAAGLARGEGLRGSKADEFLGAIVANTRAMATQGVRMDVGSVESFIGRMRGAIGGGRVGMYGPQAVSGLMGAVSGARGQIGAPFAGLGQAAVMAEAMRTSDGTYSGLMKGVEAFDDPEKVRAAITRHLGGGEASAATIGMLTGLPMGMAETLAGGDFAGQKPAYGGAKGFTRDELLETTNLAIRASNDPMRKVMTLSYEVLKDMRDKMAEMINLMGTL